MDDIKIEPQYDGDGEDVYVDYGGGYDMLREIFYRKETI